MKPNATGALGSLRKEWVLAVTGLANRRIDKRGDLREDVRDHASCGMAATAAKATIPAAREYSTRSCPRVSFQNRLRNCFILPPATTALFVIKVSRKRSEGESCKQLKPMRNFIEKQTFYSRMLAIPGELEPFEKLPGFHCKCSASAGWPSGTAFCRIS
jgi:hypothetical protein